VATRERPATGSGRADIAAAADAAKYTTAETKRQEQDSTDQDRKRERPNLKTETIHDQ
jgi:hypothetical protein